MKPLSAQVQPLFELYDPLIIISALKEAGSSIITHNESAFSLTLVSLPDRSSLILVAEESPDSSEEIILTTASFETREGLLEFLAHGGSDPSPEIAEICAYLSSKVPESFKRLAEKTLSGSPLPFIVVHEVGHA